MDAGLDRKTVLITSSFYLVFPLLMIFMEAHLIPQAEFLKYALGKAFVLILMGSCFLSALVGRIPPYYPFVYYFTGTFYAIHGQWFQPNYWLAFDELQAFFPIFFLMRVRTMIILYVAGVVSFNLFFVLTAERHIAAGVFSRRFVQDSVVGTMIFSIIALYFYDTLVVMRTKATHIQQRFMDLGRHVAYTIHDLKGMLSTPLLYVRRLEQVARNGQLDLENQTIVEYLSEDMTTLERFIHDITRFITGETATRIVCVSESLSLVQGVLSRRLKGISLELIGDLCLETKVDVINRILLNALLNSLDALSRKGLSEKRIVILCEGRTLSITDNSGSRLSPKQLRILNDPRRSYSDKPGGSGLGTLIIKDYAGSIGGTVLFSNARSGVAITIVFPKNSIKTVTSAEAA